MRPVRDDDTRPDELLAEAGRIAARLGLAVGWTDGVTGADAKAVSGTGSRAWKNATRFPNAENAAGHYVQRCRRRNPVTVASRSVLLLVEVDLNVADDVVLDDSEVELRVSATLARVGLDGLPPTCVVRSRRGLHFYFHPPDGCAPAKVQVSESGDVVWSEDGYVVAPPGMHELNGVVYRYLSEREIAVVPQAAYDLLFRLGNEARESARRSFEQGEPIPTGFRNDAIFHEALKLVHLGKSRREIAERLHELNRMCQPPLDEGLVEKQLRGAIKWAVNHPTAEDELRARARGALQAPADVATTPTRDTPTWEAPVPLVGRGQVPAFPVVVLPEALREWVVQIACEKAASVDLAGVLVLGVVSGAIARHVQVTPRPGWPEPVNLYLVVALEAGQRKTPIFKAAFRPVRSIEHARMRAWTEQDTVTALSSAILDRRRKDLISEAADEDDLDPEELRLRMEAAFAGLGELETRPRPRLLTEDVTPEGLAALLAAHGRIIAASDEGMALIENLSGRYAHGSTSWDIFNKSHSAGDLAVDRKGSEPVIVWDPALTLVLATQPKALRDLWGKPGAAGRGVLARPLYALPEPVFTSGRTPQADAEVLARYEALVSALFEDVPLLVLDQDGKPQPVTLRLDAAAEALFERYEEEVAHARRALGTSDEAEDEAAYLGWLSKLAGQVARLAACLHVAEHWTAGVTTAVVIGAGPVGGAVELGRYFHAHALVGFGLMGQLPEQRRALTILRWLRAREPAEIETLTVRDVHRSRGKGTTAAEVRAALRLLEEHGFVRIERARAGGATRGPASERVRVNPHLYNENPIDTPDKPDEFRKPVGPVGPVTGILSCAEHPDAGSWRSRDGEWRCRECEPPRFPSEIVEEAG